MSKKTIFYECMTIDFLLGKNASEFFNVHAPSIIRIKNLTCFLYFASRINNILVGMHLLLVTLVWHLK